MSSFKKTMSESFRQRANRNYDSERTPEARDSGEAVFSNGQSRQRDILSGKKGIVVLTLIKQREQAAEQRNPYISTAFTSTPVCQDIKNTIDCACLRSYILQILAPSGAIVNNRLLSR